MTSLSKLLVNLVGISGVTGGAIATFLTHLSPGAKGAIGSATLGLIGWWLREHHATIRNETTAAAALGHAPVHAPSPAEALAMARHIAADVMGQHPAQGTPVPQNVPPAMGAGGTTPTT